MIRSEIIALIVGIVFSGMFMLLSKYFTVDQRAKVYVLDESKFFEIASLGLVSDHKNVDQSHNQFNKDISQEERAKISELMKKLKKVLSSDYKANPILIEKKNKQLEIYSDVEVVDITNDVLKKVLGSKWEQIGKTFLR